MAEIVAKDKSCRNKDLVLRKRAAWRAYSSERGMVLAAT
jgi:hypothetical protein